jgi:hypothetical protein
MKILTFILAIALGVFVNGCASIPFASGEEDKKAKSFTVDAGKSNIYVYQIESDEGANVRVTLNGREAGKLGPRTFFMWSVDPGRHVIGSVIEDTTKLTIETGAGKNYFIWQDIERGSTFGGRIKISLELKEVSFEEGSMGVKESKRIASKI